MVNSGRSKPEKKKGRGDLPDKVVPKHEELGHVLYGVLEPEHVTKTEAGQFVVAGNWSVGANVVNFVAK